MNPINYDIERMIDRVAPLVTNSSDYLQEASEIISNLNIPIGFSYSNDLKTTAQNIEKVMR